MLKAAVECPVCHSTQFKSLFALQGADVVKCEACELAYVPSPIPEVTAIYKASYFKGDQKVHGYGNYEAEYECHYKTFEARLRATELLLKKKGRVLDMGCALGHFGKVAKDYNWDVYVTDVSDFAVQKSVIDFGLKGFVSPSEKLPVKRESFDCVTLFDVIEHVNQPLDLLKRIRKALKPEGLLHLTTPDYSSFSSYLMGRHWYHLKPDEHLVYFNRKNIAMALEKAGYEVVQIRAMATYMRLRDIWMRLSRYSKGVAAWGSRLCEWVGMNDLKLKIFIGEMEVWARPSASDPRKNDLESFNLASHSELLRVVACPHCEGPVEPTVQEEKEEVICVSCDLSYEVLAGVIDFSRYSKRSNKLRAI